MLCSISIPFRRGVLDRACATQGAPADLARRSLGARRRELTVVVTGLVLCGACSRASKLPAALTPLSGESAEITITRGLDTLGVELVTSCPNQLIADTDVLQPRTHVHYEAELAPDGMPRLLTIGIWRGDMPVSGLPSQVVRHATVAGRGVTEVWTGSSYEQDRATAVGDAYPFVPNYPGLFMQLLHVLRRTSDSSSGVPVQYVGIGGAAARAWGRLVRRDSLVLNIDSVAAVVRLGRDGQMLETFWPSTGVRFRRRPLDPIHLANARCGRRGFLTPTGKPLPPASAT